MTYSWTPTIGLSNTSVANPYTDIESTIEYTKKRIIKLQGLLGNEEKSDADNQTLKQQIAENEKYIEYKIDEQKEIEKTYFEYITRFKELKGLD